MKLLGSFVGSNVVTAVILNAEGEVTQLTAESSHPNYGGLRKAISDKDGVAFMDLYDPKVKIEHVVVNGVRTPTGIVVDDDGNVVYQGQPLNHVVVQEIQKAIKESRDIITLKAFLVELYKNSSSRAINELYGFIEAGGLTLTEDGCFLAYKSVRNDFFSKTAGDLVLIQGTVNDEGRIYNAVGEIVECNRQDVDDEKDRTCSKGLHAGALSYAGPNGYFNRVGDKVVIVKINPKDVVSVPSDHSNQKLRTCKYEVVAEFKAALNAPVYSGAVDPVGDEYDYDDEYDDSDEWDDEDYDDVFSSYDMMDGHLYSFDYYKPGECTKRRYVLVTDTESEDDSVLCTLVHPEENCGEVRRFKHDQIENVESFSL